MRRHSLSSIAAVAVILGLASLVAWAAARWQEVRHTADTVATLRSDLRLDNIHKRADAARAIHKLGPLAKDAVPELVDALKLAVEKMNVEHVSVLGGSYQHFVLAPRDMRYYRKTQGSWPEVRWPTDIRSRPLNLRAGEW